MKKLLFLLLTCMLIISCTRQPIEPGTNTTPGQPFIILPEPGENATPNTLGEYEGYHFGIHGNPIEPEYLSDLGLHWVRPGLHPGASFAGKTEIFDARYQGFYDVGANILENFLVFNRGGTCVPEDASWMVDVVKRYDTDTGVARMRYYQIGNEVDSMAGQKCDPADYVATLKKIVPQLRQACPDCKILMSGVLSPEYVGWVLDNGGGEYFDIIDMHLFYYAKEYKYLEDGVDLYIKQLSDHGVEKDIWSCEIGTPSGTFDGRTQTEDEQAGFMVRAYTILLSKGVKKMFWAWGLHEGFGGDGNTFFDQTGLIYDGKGASDKGAGVKKKIYYTYKLLTEKLEGVTFVRKTNPEANVYVYEFSKGSDTIYVAWKDTWLVSNNQDSKISLPGSRATVTEAVTGESRSVKEYNPDEIPISDVPLYIEIEK